MQWSVFPLKSHAPGSRRWYQQSFCCSTLLKITVFDKEIPADSLLRWTVFIPSVHFKIIGLHGKRGVRSMSPHASWTWSHFGKWNSNELRVPDEWLWTNSVWQLTEAHIYLNEPLRKTNSNVFAACKYYSLTDWHTSRPILASEDALPQCTCFAGTAVL